MVNAATAFPVSCFTTFTSARCGALQCAVCSKFLLLVCVFVFVYFMF